MDRYQTVTPDDPTRRDATRPDETVLSGRAVRLVYETYTGVSRPLKIEFQKSKMADGHHFENRYFAIYLHTRLTDFDISWHADAEPVS